MTRSSSTPPDAEAMRAIFAAGASECSSPEELHRLAIGELPPARCEELREHAADCPMCAVELELASDFAAGPDPAAAGAHRDDLAAIRRRLEANAPHRTTPAAGDEEAAGRRPAAARVLRFPTRFGPAAALLAAAALALAVGLGLHSFQPSTRPGEAPPLPPRPPAGSERGTTITGLAPAGDLDASPNRFVWQPVDGAARYRLTLRAVDDAVLWETETSGTAAELASDVIRLSPAVSYAWSVEAVDSAGRSLAWSERARFRIRPQPEGAISGDSR